MSAELITISGRVPAPTPAQVHAWLVAHGWTSETPNYGTSGMGFGRAGADEWRDYVRDFDGERVVLTVPQIKPFSAAMTTVLDLLAAREGVDQLELYRQIIAIAEAERVSRLKSFTAREIARYGRQKRDHD